MKDRATFSLEKKMLAKLKDLGVQYGFPTSTLLNLILHNFFINVEDGTIQLFPQYNKQKKENDKKKKS